MSRDNALLKLIQDKYGADKHPILVMAEIAFDEEETDKKLKLDASKSMMPYLEAQKKAVDVKANVNGNVGLLRVTMVDDSNEGGGLADDDDDEADAGTDD